MRINGCICRPGSPYLCPWCTALAHRAGVTLAPVLTPRQVLEVRVQDEAPEGVLQGRIRELALETGHLFYHTYSSKRSDPGWVDIAICHPDRPGPLFLWELKSRNGEMSPAQRRWLDALNKVTRVEAACYRPADWPLIVESLTRRP